MERVYVIVSVEEGIMYFLHKGNRWYWNFVDGDIVQYKTLAGATRKCRAVGRPAKVLAVADGQEYRKGEEVFNNN